LRDNSRRARFASGSRFALKKLVARSFTGQRAELPDSTPITAGLKTKLTALVLKNLLFLMAALFLSARTFQFWQAWAFIGVSSVSTLATLNYLYRHDPEALARRTLRRETISVQKVIILFMKGLYAFCFILAGLDFRFGWTRLHTGPVPGWLSLVALGIVVLADFWFVAVLEANRFGSSVIQVEDGQSVAANGPYRWVRHPMYLGWIVRWLVTPLALGSLMTFPLFCLIIPLLSLRLLNEEKFLKRELPGYAEYCRQVRWRLVPYVW
jgi:protein-S-isoprenylcysteine O-methyltransferase Ste14